MSKEAAMAMLTGNPNPVVTPSLITGDMNRDNPKPVDVPAEPTKPVDTGADAGRWASLAKKEAEIVKSREAFKKEQAELADTKAKAQEVLRRAQEFEAQKATDPVAALKGLGFSETDIFNFLSNGDKKEPTIEEKAAEATREELDKFKKELSDKEQKAQQERDTTIINGFKTKLTQAVEAGKADKFKFCAFVGKSAQDLAFDIVKECVNQGQPPPTAEEALLDAEEYYKEYFMGASSLMAPKEAAVIEKVEPTRSRTMVAPAASSPIAPPKTLTNRVTATASSQIPRAETREQKRERLMESLRRMGT